MHEGDAVSRQDFGCGDYVNVMNWLRDHLYEYHEIISR